MADKVIGKLIGVVLIVFGVAFLVTLYGVLRHPPARFEWFKYLIVLLVSVTCFWTGWSCVKG